MMFFEGNFSNSWRGGSLLTNVPEFKDQQSCFAGNFEDNQWLVLESQNKRPSLITLRVTQNKILQTQLMVYHKPDLMKPLSHL